MTKVKKVSNNTKSNTAVEKPNLSILDRMESEVQANQSRVSLVLGALIVLVVGVLIFNYFNKGKSTAEVTPTATQTENNQDVSKENLPGKYTIKEGDTLFLIAQKYYQNGENFLEIAKANSITNFDSIVAGQILEIPKLDITPTATQPSSSPEASNEPTPTPTSNPEAATIQPTITTQDFGPAITGDKYTVVEGDWLSTIAARSYNGDVLSYTKIAQANNITNPDYIQAGTVLSIPR